MIYVLEHYQAIILTVRGNYMQIIPIYPCLLMRTMLCPLQNCKDTYSTVTKLRMRTISLKKPIEKYFLNSLLSKQPDIS